MTIDRDFDRQLATWFDERATLRVPDGVLGRCLERIVVTGQRPGWLVLDRGPSPRPLGWPATASHPMRTRLAAVGVIGLLAVGGAFYAFQRNQPAVGPPSQTPSPSSSPVASPSAVPSPSVVGPRAASWTQTGSMITPRESHTATLLPDGKVLVAGGLGSYVDPSGAYVRGSLALAELYDPATGTWTATGSMGTARESHTATLLPDGKVLVAGGLDRTSADFNGTGLVSAELYDPDTGTWTATGDMLKPRVGGLATLLPNGKVLISGGAVPFNKTATGSAWGDALPELFDPASGTWTATRKMVFGGGAVATLLPDGKVLVASGQGPGVKAELYDPSRGTWTATGTMVHEGGGMATLLLDGKVLMACGCDWAGRASALYDPATGSWAATGTMVEDHWRDTATFLPDGSVTLTLLPDGKVLVAGGGSPALPAAELYDPSTGTWAATAAMLAVRVNHTATLLPDGTVLVAGGSSRVASASVELYDPGIAP